MATEKRKMCKVLSDGSLIQILPETSADQVTITNIGTDIKSTKVQGALSEIYEIAKTGGVTGVKGDKELKFRKGDVNITPVNIGALPDTTKYGATIDLAYATDTGIITVKLKDQDSTVLSTKTIDLPLEMMVQSGTVETCTQANTPVQGYKVGDIYIDLVLAKSSEHIYILASDLIDEITDTQSGTGNVVTSVTANKHSVTVTKGITAITSVNGHTGAVVSVDKQDLNLENVDNTADINKNVASASKLTSLKTFKITGAVNGEQSSDLSNGITINVSIANGSISDEKLSHSVIAKAGATAVTYNSKGLITSSGTCIEFGTNTNNKPSDNLIAGGLFFELQ